MSHVEAVSHLEPLSGFDESGSVSYTRSNRGLASSQHSLLTTECTVLLVIVETYHICMAVNHTGARRAGLAHVAGWTGATPVML